MSRHISHDDAASRVVSRSPPAPYSTASVRRPVRHSALPRARSQRFAADDSSARAAGHACRRPSSRRSRPSRAIAARFSRSPRACSCRRRDDHASVAEQRRIRRAGAGGFLARHRMHADQRSFPVISGSNSRTTQPFTLPTSVMTAWGGSVRNHRARTSRASCESAPRASPNRRRARLQPGRASRDRSSAAIARDIEILLRTSQPDDRADQRRFRAR